MKQISIQFKRDTGLTMRELSKKVGKSNVWVTEFVNGEYKDRKNIDFSINAVATFTGIPIEVIRKYAKGEVSVDNNVIPIINPYHKYVRKQWDSVVLAQKIQKLENQIQAIIGE
jgi:transcriptional regulator with XRE-family HTH domain